MVGLSGFLLPGILGNETPPFLPDDLWPGPDLLFDPGLCIGGWWGWKSPGLTCCHETRKCWVLVLNHNLRKHQELNLRRLEEERVEKVDREAPCPDGRAAQEERSGWRRDVRSCPKGRGMLLRRRPSSEVSSEETEDDVVESTCRIRLLDDDDAAAVALVVGTLKCYDLCLHGPHCCCCCCCCWRLEMKWVAVLAWVGVASCRHGDAYCCGHVMGNNPFEPMTIGLHDFQSHFQEQTSFNANRYR